MQDTEELLRKARELGEALAAHPSVKAHQEAQRAIRADDAARKLLQDYQRQLNYVQELQAQQKPIEVADKHKLKELEAQMAGHHSLKMLMRTQADYIALMSQINQTMERPLVALNESEKPA